MTPEIKVIRTWNSGTVRMACIDNKLYTKGTNKDYLHLMNQVWGHEPTDKQLYIVAKDIMEHSEDQTITNIMFLLEKYAVITTFEIEEK